MRTERLEGWKALVRHPGRFLWHTVLAFRLNQGVLLSGAVAYYTLLSIVPLLALVLVGLSHFVDETALLASVHTHLNLIVPAEADELTHQIRAFLDEREVIGWIGLAVLLFFSTLAFTVLENAMSVIFFHRVSIHRRHFLVSATIPFAFILLLGLGVLLVTFIAGAMQTFGEQELRLFGFSWGMSGVSSLILYLLGVLGLVLLLTSLYLVMPVGSISLRHALVGGAIAAVLWELVRHGLVWWFNTLSVVNLVYGSLASAVIALLSFEAAALILLFGAQVIAELERAGLERTEDRGSAFRT